LRSAFQGLGLALGLSIQAQAGSLQPKQDSTPALAEPTSPAKFEPMQDPVRPAPDSSTPAPAEPASAAPAPSGSGSSISDPAQVKKGVIIPGWKTKYGKAPKLD
jgi:hypothetical protein